MGSAFPDVYVSYSRRDKDFVARLHDALEAHGRAVWVDWDDIPASADWRKEIDAAIETADAFLFVLSPDALASEPCAHDLRHALEEHKRIVPLLHRELDPASVPEPLASRQWISFRSEDEFEAGIELLLQALDTDLERVRAHTRLLARAHDWERSGRDRSYRLRGAELRAAHELLAQGSDREPLPTALTREYVLESEKGSLGRLRRRPSTASSEAPGGPVTKDATSAAFEQAPPPARPRTGFEIRARAISDLPSADDVLGFGPLVRGLAALLNDRHTTLPLAIAVTAPWGAGKSSLMLQLRRRLEAPPGPQQSRYWYTISFDAWKYERSERMWAALAKAIYDQTQRDMTHRERVWFRVRLERERQGLRRYAAKALAAPVALLGGLAVAALPAISTGASATVIAGGAAAAVAAAGRYWGVVGDPFKRAIDHYVSQPRYEEQLGFTPDAEEEIKSLTRVLGCDQDAGGGRGWRRTGDRERALAIFVDDLDRCSARHVVEVVEAINQIFNAGEGRRCVFVLGMDSDVVAASIDVAYRDTVDFLSSRGSPLATNFGLHFLAKIVQMTIAIPEPDEPAMARLLTHITGNPPRDDSDGADPSPEDVERFRKVISEMRPQNPVDVEEISGRVGADLELDELGRSALAEAKRLERAELFTTDSEDVAKSEFEVLRHLVRNPRAVKRFDNALRLQLHVANGTPRCRLDFNKDQLVALGKWVGLRLSRPDLARAIDSDPTLLDALEASANAPGDGSDGDSAAATVRDAHLRWLADPELIALLTEERPERRISSLPLDSFLRTV